MTVIWHQTWCGSVLFFVFFSIAWCPVCALFSLVVPGPWSGKGRKGPLSIRPATERRTAAATKKVGCARLDELVTAEPDGPALPLALRGVGGRWERALRFGELLVLGRAGRRRSEEGFRKLAKAGWVLLVCNRSANTSHISGCPRYRNPCPTPTFRLSSRRPSSRAPCLRA